MSRAVGYLISVVGLIILVLGVAPLNAEIVPYVPVLGGIPSYLFFGLGVIVLVIGVMFLRKSGGKQAKEVPIYHGKNVVGFRRMGKWVSLER